jgi:hypothetical protein
VRTHDRFLERGCQPALVSVGRPVTIHHQQAKNLGRPKCPEQVRGLIHLRPAAYMETWARVLGEPLIKTGKTMIFGPGNQPINFVSAYDVALVVELAVIDPSMHGEVVDVVGPENLSFNRFVEIFEAVTGKSGRKKHLPLPVMRAVSVLMRPINPILARQARAGVTMNTRDMSFDTSQTTQRYPSITPTKFEDVVRREYGSGVRDLAGALSI